MKLKQFGDFSESAAKAIDDLHLRFSEEQGESYDFARCQRADGSFYGTSGQCRTGKEAGDKPAEQTRAKATRSGGVSNEQAMKLRASLTKQIGDAAKSGDLGKTNNLMQALAAVEGQLKARGVNLSGGGAMADAKAGERKPRMTRASKVKELEAKIKDLQSRSESELNKGFRDRALQLSKEANKLMQEKADLQK